MPPLSLADEGISALRLEASRVKYILGYTVFCDRPNWCGKAGVQCPTGVVGLSLVHCKVSFLARHLRGIFGPGEPAFF